VGFLLSLRDLGGSGGGGEGGGALRAGAAGGGGVGRLLFPLVLGGPFGLAALSICVFLVVRQRPIRVVAKREDQVGKGTRLGAPAPHISDDRSAS